MRITTVLLLVLGLCGAGPAVAQSCRDSVVLVHGNASYPFDFDHTVAELRARGYGSAQIHAPSWGNKFCPACNDHQGSEETPVEQAIRNALSSSCTGRIDVIGHSMGATLAARVITRLNVAHRVDAFVGIAGAFRGLWTCGTYPWNVANSTCGAWGLSVQSPFLNSIQGLRFGTRMISVYSWTDQVVCATGVCTVGGVHSSRMVGENQAIALPMMHFSLVHQTWTLQADLIQ